jgi:hypothetical protein
VTARLGKNGSKTHAQVSHGRLAALTLGTRMRLCSTCGTALRQAHAHLASGSCFICPFLVVLRRRGSLVMGHLACALLRWLSRLWSCRCPRRFSQMWHETSGAVPIRRPKACEWNDDGLIWNWKGPSSSSLYPSYTSGAVLFGSYTSRVLQHSTAQHSSSSSSSSAPLASVYSTSNIPYTQ